MTNQRIEIECPRSLADDVEAKILELDPNARIDVVTPPKLVGVIETLSIIASLSTIAASGFIVWSEAQRNRGIVIDASLQTGKAQTQSDPEETQS